MAIVEKEQHNLIILALLLLNKHSSVPVWKSKRHNQGTPWEDWFIVGVNFQSSNIVYGYLPSFLWDLTDVPELDEAPSLLDFQLTEEECILRFKNLIQIITNE